MVSSTEHVIGIDLGTTNSCVAYWNQANQAVEILAGPDGQNTFPSWVSYGDDGENIIVGRAACNHSNFFYDIKRIIGQSHAEIRKDKSIQRRLPYTLTKGSEDRCVIKPFKNVNRNIEPEEVATKILGHAKKIAEERVGCPVTKAVITVPAYFTNTQKQSTHNAARIAGFDVLRLINEPTSAAMACDLQQIDETKVVLVFDFGGGTFDCTILEESQGQLAVSATVGDMRLGGRDLDDIILQMCFAALQDAAAPLLQVKAGQESQAAMNNFMKDMGVRNRLTLACEIAKIDLSVNLETTITVEALVKDNDFFEDLDLALVITRADFEEKAEPVLERLLKPVTEALQMAQMEKEEIESVLIVGGSTRIPKVREMLKEFFSIEELDETINADEGVAYGAAKMAAQLTGQIAADEQVIVCDVIPQSLGIELANDEVDVIIKATSRFPLEKTEEYETLKDDQTKMKINLRQGDSQKASECHLAGKFTLSGIPPGEAGSQKVLVTFKIDANGLLDVTAAALGASGVTASLCIDNVNGNMSQERILELQQAEAALNLL